MRFHFWTSSMHNECSAKGNMTQVGKEDRGHRRKKNPMDAKWGHGRAEAAAGGTTPGGLQGGSLTTLSEAPLST